MQRLAALAVDVGSLERLCSSDAALLPRWRSIRESAAQLVDDMHHFAYRLHPSTLEHLGLEAALRDHITEFAQRTGPDVQYVVRNVPGTIRIEQATCLYRITQESLQNVYKHALQGQQYLTPSITKFALEQRLKSEEPPEVKGVAADLTPRQREVLQLIGEGKGTKDIAAVLNVSVKTIEFHKTCLMKGLDLHSTAELMRYAITQGLASDQP